jgi:anti-anti-sigma regulatory factor
MTMNKDRHMIRSTVIRGVKVVRFTSPDLRAHLDGDTDDCELFRALRDGPLAALEEGQTLVLNFGLIEPFTTAFYSCLIKVREVVLARKARLVLCRLHPEHLEIFQIFQAERLFHIKRTEAQALQEVGAHHAYPMSDKRPSGGSRYFPAP